MKFPIAFAAVLVLLSGLGYSPLYSQDEQIPQTVEVVFTPDMFPRRNVERSQGDYLISATPSFVDELVKLHLAGTLTLYRDGDLQIPYPNREQLEGYKKEVNDMLPPLTGKEGEAMLAFDNTQRTRGLNSGRVAFGGRKPPCTSCLDSLTLWMLRYSQDYQSILGEGKEAQFSLAKQVRRSQVDFSFMAPYQYPNIITQPYFMMKGKASLTLAKGNTQGVKWQQGVVMVEFQLNPKEGAASQIASLHFDLKAKGIPWHMMELRPFTSAIVEGRSVRSILEQDRSALQIVGYKLPTDRTWKSLFDDFGGRKWRQDSLRADSLLKAWQIRTPLYEPAELVRRYPLQSKFFTLYMDAAWPPPSFSHVPITDWTLKQHKKKDWAETHMMLDSLSQKILNEGSQGIIPLYSDRWTEVNFQLNGRISWSEVVNYRNRYISEWLFPAEMAYVPSDEASQPRGEGAPARPVTVIPENWVDLTSQTYTWQVRGHLLWTEGEVTFEPEWIDIIWEVPNELFPDLLLCSVPMWSLVQADIRYKGQPILEVLESLDYGYYPMQINQSQLWSYDQATYYKKILESGAWDCLPPWLEKGYFPSTYENTADFWKQAWKKTKKELKGSAYR